MTNLNVRNSGRGSGGAAVLEERPSAPTSLRGSVSTPRTVVICDTQPVMAEGVHTLLNSSTDLRFQQSVDSLPRALELLQRQAPDVLLLDKAYGIQAILEWLSQSQAASSSTSVVIWGVSVTEAEALRFL